MATAKRTRSAATKTASKAKAPNGNQAAEYPQPNGVLEEMIRVRAYQLYAERGFKDGHAQEDWLRAEAEVRNQERHT